MPELHSNNQLLVSFPEGVGSSVTTDDEYLHEKRSSNNGKAKAVPNIPLQPKPAQASFGQSTIDYMSKVIAASTDT